MSIKALIFCVTVAVTSCSLSTEVQGQRGRPALNQGFRYLGGGQSAGYHWRTPGPNVNYYSPWSWHNTNMRTGIVPQGAGIHLSQAGNCWSNPMPFDLSDNYENFGPYINQPAPSTAAPANVIDSEIDEDASQSEPESVLRNPENQQPTPSDDTTMLWPGYFQPSPDRAVPNRIQVRQPAFRNTSPQKRK